MITKIAFAVLTAIQCAFAIALTIQLASAHRQFDEMKAIAERWESIAHRWQATAESFERTNQKNESSLRSCLVSARMLATR